MAWKIHTGPFPFIVQDFAGELWLWRVTDGTHFTSITVTFADTVRHRSPEELSQEVRKAVETRGRSAVSACLSWAEPPREIAYIAAAGTGSYWGGHR
ncbi:MAG TPA: hypothetical protein VJ927_09245 [Actinomycetota bacterium]|nr:hypothetical protein [Actinomycetota bacterium]